MVYGVVILNYVTHILDFFMYIHAMLSQTGFSSSSQTRGRDPFEGWQKSEKGY